MAIFYYKNGCTKRMFQCLANSLIAASIKWSRIPFISNLKTPACVSKRDVLELTTVRYVHFFYQYAAFRECNFAMGSDFVKGFCTRTSELLKLYD